MSFYQLRRIPDNRSRIRELANAFNRFKSRQNVRESDDADFMRLMRTGVDAVGLSDNIYATEVIPRARLFQLPMEPDGVFLRFWLRFDDPNTYELDSSGFGSSAEVKGNGTIYKGGKFGLAIRFDGQQSRVVVTNNSSVGLSTSFSISVWVNPELITLSGPEDTTKRRIAVKADDASNGYQLSIDSNGDLQWVVRWLGNNYSSTKLNGFNSLNTWFLVVATWNSALIGAGTPAQCFVNNAPYNTTGAADAPTFPAAGANTNLLLGAKEDDSGVDNGHFKGMMDDFRYYKGMAFTTQQRTNLWTNLYSISNIPLNQVAVLGRWYFVRQSSWRVQSFHGQSFTVL